MRSKPHRWALRNWPTSPQPPAASLASDDGCREFSAQKFYDDSKINLGLHGALNDSTDGMANLIRKFAQV